MSNASRVIKPEEILLPIQSQMERVEFLVLKNLETEIPLLTEIGQYILQAGGKRIRPALVLLSARTFGGDGDDICQAANIIEYIHTATLLHDDVVDNAEIRRSKKSARSIWGNEASILVGDYLFTLSFKLLATFKSISMVETLSQATTMMARGEILQLTRTYENCDEKSYFEIVSHKTASLIGAAMAMGGILGGANPEQQKILQDCGAKIGTAFQIADDVLDYSLDNQELGKKPGIDLKERKITLPLSHLLQNASSQDKERILDMMDEDVITDDHVREITRFTHHYHSLEYSLDEAQSYANVAINNLAALPDNVFRRSIEKMALYAIQRTN